MSETYSDGWGKGLKRRVLLASAWAIVTSIAGQGIRFASVLILSHLLFPEAFGMMALVAAVMSGLEMFSDIGIGPSVISNREPSRRFLDTMWSLQVVRGWVLWAISVVLAYPVARWYGEPMLSVSDSRGGRVEHHSRLCAPLSIHSEPRTQAARTVSPGGRLADRRLRHIRNRRLRDAQCVGVGHWRFCQRDRLEPPDLLAGARTAKSLVLGS